MDINGKTRLIGLIGNPVEHTLSPVIHNGISNALDISSVYVPFKVSEEGVSDAVKGAYELNVLGMNVTVPHKNRVMNSLVDIDEDAANIGAVNTLVRNEDKHGYKGYNTDMLGLRRQIKEDNISIAGRHVVVLGAGGAAKSVVYMCLLEGAKRVYILNRTFDNAKAIADSMNKLVGDNIYTHSEQRDIVIPMLLSEYDKLDNDRYIVFQATSIGLSPNVDDVIIDDPSFYKKVEVGVDLIYNPAKTGFMKLVIDNGGKAYNALKMLLYQGVIAYELWHDIKVPEDIVKDVFVELKRRVYPKDNIVLIGFMGSGKTTIGKALARQRSMEFLDTDEYIEKREGMSISEIFKDKGEEEFRRLETCILSELADSLSNTVVSTGGGLPLRMENARLLKEFGKVYYLKVPDEMLYMRLKNDTDRPLLQCDDPYERICSLMKERSPLYERACDIVIDNTGSEADSVMNIGGFQDVCK